MCSICLIARSSSQNKSKSVPQSLPSIPMPLPPLPEPNPPPPEPSPGPSNVPSHSELMQLPLESRQRITADTLKELAGSSKGFVSVKTGGRPLPVQLGARPKEVKQMPQENLFKLQNERRFSDRDMSAIATTVRDSFGNLAVEPGLEKALSDRPKEIAPFFTSKSLPFENKANREMSTGVFCTDPLNFVRKILTHRNIAWSDDWFLRVGIDNGGPEDSGSDSLKMTANLVVVESPETPTTPLTPMSPPSKKSSFDFESNSSKFKDTGEKQSLIFCLVPDVKESPKNTQIIFQNIDFSGLESRIKFSCDLKMCNIQNGQQHHKASFPCNYCTWQYQGHTSLPRLKMVPVLYDRRVGNQKALAAAYQEAQSSSQPKHAMLFYSTVNTPCLVGPDDMLILDLFPPPELHIFTGVIQHVIAELNEQWGCNRLKTWLFDNGIKQKKFTYQGPACKALLNTKLQALKTAVPSHLQKYVVVLEKFRLVKDSCFSDTLAPNYKECIHDFKLALLSCMKEFPKAHILWTHVPEFCDKYQRGLAIYSEQCSETVHKEYNKVYKNYKSFPDGHLQAVLKYNVQNM